jgi:hypothetical protein
MCKLLRPLAVLMLCAAAAPCFVSRADSQRVRLQHLKSIVGGGLCQYPQLNHICTDCVNQWECDDTDLYGHYRCQSYTGYTVFNCTLNASSFCSGIGWEVIGCVLYTGFFDDCPTEFNSYTLTQQSGACT